MAGNIYGNISRYGDYFFLHLGNSTYEKVAYNTTC
jgi:hypothetical protein